MFLLGRRFIAPMSRRTIPQLPRRTFFVQTKPTPNPDSLQFFPDGVKVMQQGTIDFADAFSARRSPLAKLLFQQEGVKRVFLGPDFITVTKDDESEWDYLKPVVYGTLTEFYSSGQPVLLEEDTLPRDTQIHEDDPEAVQMIKELLETRIRPALQSDGGDITYHGFVEGVVFLQLQGSCEGCPSSSATMKSGIERMLTHWVPEVSGVMEVTSREQFIELTTGIKPENPTLEDVSREALKRLESNIEENSGRE